MAGAWYLLPAKTKNETLIIAMSWQKVSYKNMGQFVCNNRLTKVSFL